MTWNPFMVLMACAAEAGLSKDTKPVVQVPRRGGRQPPPRERPVLATALIVNRFHVPKHLDWLVSLSTNTLADNILPKFWKSMNSSASP